MVFERVPNALVPTCHVNLIPISHEDKAFKSCIACRRHICTRVVCSHHALVIVSDAAALGRPEHI